MGFRDPVHPDYVCLLKKSMYGLKQAPRAWYQRFADFVFTIGFSDSKSDHSLFIYQQENDMTYILLYVDDIILTTSSDALRQSIMTLLASEFAMNYAIYLSGNPVQHQRTKHIEMDIYFVREKVARGQVRVLHVPSRYQIADIFTKGIPHILFDDFRDSLSIRKPPTSTSGIC
ncbi:NBS-containing resistance-like protein [Trifolium pratense]|uniref:NBS-containing resistance-like protein n=1 Tax=Trifolium pratense TaxID=57577 RepID=A0A2K3M8H2_TRIPR|nr:NBS-containing resistance-like protein [Trifolium pratense]PNX87713.1 NBS-containing resistance-like protein [Trifolium pratense]